MSDNKVAAANAANVSSTEETPIIFLDDVKVTFNTRTGSLLHPNKVQALRGITLKLMKGETLGIVGESGCGKSTTANVICGLQKPTSGHVYFQGRDVTNRTAEDRRTIGRVISVVFQDPATALNARMTIHDQLLDPMLVHKWGTKETREKRIFDLIGMVGLPKSVMGALPASSPVASASAWPSPEPCPWNRLPSSPTSPRAPLTCRSARRSSTCLWTSSATWALPWCSSATTSRPCAISPTASSS